MMTEFVIPAPLDLGDHLRLRMARADDIDAIVDFNTQIFDERVTDWTRDLISGRHPTVRVSDFTLVEDTRTKQIVSSMCLISQTWLYGGSVTLPAGRCELIATNPTNRRRGLIRRQFDV